jgi:NAD-dependent deacetylase
MKTIASRLNARSRITVVTGAGVSAASGVPTFRGPDGLWRNFRPETLGTTEAFRRDPRLVWEWYDWRRQVIATKEPNGAHDVLARWSRRFPGFTLITQNVDGLHERAGTENVVRFHGSIWDVSCWDRCKSSPRRWRNELAPLPQIPPECPHCGGLIRPGVVWFGEGIDDDVVQRSMEAVNCDVFFTIGTSSLVYPAAGLLAEAKAHGAFTVEMNLERTPASTMVDIALQGKADELLMELDSLLV